MNPEIDFLLESNAIEGVYDPLSLAQAILAWNYIRPLDIVTPEVILKVHNILMLRHLEPHDRGKFRHQAVWIGGKEGKHWADIPMFINDWCARANQFDDPKANHVYFEAIHPFIDGNGRTGRILMNWQCLKKGVPLIIIHEGDEQQEYYKWFDIKS